MTSPWRIDIFSENIYGNMQAYHRHLGELHYKHQFFACRKGLAKCDFIKVCQSWHYTANRLFWFQLYVYAVCVWFYDCYFMFSLFSVTVTLMKYFKDLNLRRNGLNSMRALSELLWMYVTLTNLSNFIWLFSSLSGSGGLKLLAMSYFSNGLVVSFCHGSHLSISGHVKWREGNCSSSNKGSSHEHISLQEIQDMTCLPETNETFTL